MRRSERDTVIEKGALKIWDVFSKSSVSKISEFLHIDGWHPISQLYTYLTIFGATLLLLTLWFLPWFVMWIYVIFVIILSGFVTAPPGKRFNFVTTLLPLVFLALLPTQFRQGAAMLDASVTDEEMTQLYGVTEDEIEEMSIREIAERLDMTKNELIESCALEDEQKTYSNKKLTKHVRKRVIAMSRIVKLTRAEIDDMTTDEISRYLELDKKELADSMRINDYEELSDEELEERLKVGLKLVKDFHQGDFLQSGYRFDFSNVWEQIQGLQENPFDDIEGYFSNFFDVINWILFLGMVAYGGAAIGNAFTLQFGKAAEKAAVIAIAVTFLVFMYALFDWVNYPVRTIWDTVGSAWENMLKAFGLATLDVAGQPRSGAIPVVDDIMRWVPLFTVCICAGLAVSLRHTAWETAMFMKAMRKDYYIKVERSKFSTFVLVILLVVVTAFSGLFLTTSEFLGPDPIVQMSFYIGTGIVLALLGFKILIVNQSKPAWEHLKDFVKWSFFGMLLLFFWFNVLQPTMYELNLLDYQSGYLFLSQEGESIFETNMFLQFFTVAIPETLIFQVLFIGVSNRVYFYLKKGRFQEAEEQRLLEKKDQLLAEKKRIKININSTSKSNIRKIARAVVLSRQLEEINQKIREGQTSRMPIKYLLLSGLIGALIGAVVFSTYHAFRRFGADWVNILWWWQNPYLGLTYFGAGMILALVVMFSWPAAIFIHFFNNMLALMMAGGGQS